MDISKRPYSEHYDYHVYEAKETLREQTKTQFLRLMT